MSDSTEICTTGLAEGEAFVLARRIEDIPYTQGMRGFDGQRRAWVRSADGQTWLMYPGDTLTFSYTFTDNGELEPTDDRVLAVTGPEADTPPTA